MRRRFLNHISKSIPDSGYFTIEALEDGLTAQLSTNDCEYRVDNSAWTTLSNGTNTVSINNGQTLSFKGNLTPNSSNGIGTFTISKKCNLKGNIMSLLYGDDFLDKTDLTGKSDAFYGLFKKCTNIVDASNLILPATTLAPYCYWSMFEDCTSLTTAPELPAPILSNRCYIYMFKGCTSLTTAPELPATDLASYCYCGMFSGCDSLTTAPELPATDLYIYCYQYMFQNCTSLTTAPELPATNLDSGCYYSMFKGCTSLTTAPEILPATTLSTSCYTEMFYGCTSLTTAPELPATTLADGCYYNMFGGGCTSLTTAPELPATNLVDRCYQYMFYGCTSLTTAPELPATTLANSCYYGMFSGCTSLTTAPELPATTLANNCYGRMFQNCTSLTTALELPATTLANNCYYYMFSGCSSLTTAPELPATTLANNCYYYMFQNCTSLTTAPELPATTLANNCYEFMFWNCSKLKNITMLATDISATNCLNNWVNGVASTGTFIKHKDMTTLPTGESGIPTGWTVKDYVDYTKEYFTIEALEDGLTAKLSNNCEYCVDSGTWTTLSKGTNTVSINNGQTLSFKGNMTPDSDIDNIGIGTFTISKKCNLKGNIMSLLYGDDFLNKTDLTGKDYTFSYLFSRSTNIVDASNLILPATILASECYSGMFSGCTSLTTAPEILPATTLADYCYYDMFSGCTSLTAAPELPATNLVSNCYIGMFSGCTSLTTAPELPATKLANSCYGGMFRNCSKLNNITMLATDISANMCLYQWVEGVASTGTFIKHKDMTTLPTGNNGIPNGWEVKKYGEDYIKEYFTIEALEDGLTAQLSTNDCKYRVDDGEWTTLSNGTNTVSINNGQTLSFKGNLTPNASNGIGTFIISKKCNLKGNIMSLLYGDDFLNKTDLTGKDYTFSYLFSGSTNIVDASNLILPAATLASNCYYDMFYCCTSLTTAPELPATTLVSSCYQYMFRGCDSLTTAPELPATTLTDYCYRGMFYGCDSLTTAPELPATTLADYCYQYMFYDCTSLVTAPELPATTLARECYYFMFAFCYNLNNITMLATDISATDCLNKWVVNVASTGTFTKASSMTSLPTGDNGIPSGWEIINR